MSLNQTTKMIWGLHVMHLYNGGYNLVGLLYRSVPGGSGASRKSDIPNEVGATFSDV